MNKSILNSQEEKIIFSLVAAAESFLWSTRTVRSNKLSPALTSKRNIWRIEQRQSDHPELWCCRSRNLIVEMISTQLAHKYRGRQTWGWRPSDMIWKQNNKVGKACNAMVGSSSTLMTTPLVYFCLKLTLKKERNVRNWDRLCTFTTLVILTFYFH